MKKSFRAAGVIAAVYGYFLIFAQFAWVEIMRQSGESLMSEKICLGGMALAGVVCGFVVARRGISPGLLRLSFMVAAFSAAISPWAGANPWALILSASTGAAIGGMTVTLASLLPAWCGIQWLGLGTGLGYAVCNFPAVFMATHSQQAWIGAGFALGGWLLVPGEDKSERESRDLKRFPTARAGMGVVAAIVGFTSLVWLDSAAFFIIQHSRELKVATWGEPMLWRNALIHLVAAVGAGFWLRRGFEPLLLTSWTLLAISALAVNQPETRSLAGWWYPAGVSLYSTALVAWPGYFASSQDTSRTGMRAAWIYAVAGWFGSANGIGMAQTLNRVPGAFVGAAGAVLLGGWLLGQGRWRALLVMVCTGLIAWAGIQPGQPSALSASERGKGVYIAEGCINCHSRYVRPGTSDEIRWGPPGANLDRPVMIGNRRQGPDLSQVGLRRSATWLRLHFIEPRDFSPDSPMPSYAHLFEGSTRGEDLIAWLQLSSLGKAEERGRTIAVWSPSHAEPAADGGSLFDRHCMVCHGRDRRGRGKLAERLSRQPANLIEGPFIWTPGGADLVDRIARVIKFGVPGTDMPGHETLDDGQIIALASYLLELRGAPLPPGAFESDPLLSTPGRR